MDLEYGDYGRYRNGYGHGAGEALYRVHYAQFLGSRRMTCDEPSPAEVLREIKMVINDYKVTIKKPRSYSITVSPSEVHVVEKNTSHEEVIETKFIHYCIHDAKLKNIFAFVAWSQSQNVFILHIFSCEWEREAASLKTAFAQGFQAAYRDWKNDARPPRRHIPPPREAYSEYGPPARLTRGALDHHRRSYEAPAVLEREQYRPPARVASRPRYRASRGPRPNQLIEVYGDPRQGGYDYEDDLDDDFIADVPPPRPAVEKEVVYTRETFPPPPFGAEAYDRRNGMRGATYDDDVYASRRAPVYGDRGGRRSRRYVDNGYARDDMLF